jgi:hypothetical protein
MYGTHTRTTHTKKGCELPEDDSIKAYNTLARKLLPLDEPYPKYTAGHLFAAQYVQAAVRGFLARYGISHRGGETAAAVQAAADAGAAGPQPAAPAGGSAAISAGGRSGGGSSGGASDM